VNNSIKHLKTFVIDRYEGEYAILEDKYGRTYDVPFEKLPAGTLEGDILNENQGRYVVDDEATAKKREKLRRIRNALAKNNSNSN
jgi:hypothetical protein